METDRAVGSGCRSTMTRAPDPIDAHIGRKLRERRTVRGMSQERLGQLLSVSFQQIQKYERGVSRLGPGRLREIGRVLDVPITYFFDDAPEYDAPRRTGHASPGMAEDEAPFDLPKAPRLEDLADAPPLAHRDVLELVRGFQRIRDPAVRRRIGELVRALGSAAYRDDAAPGPDP